MKHKNEHEFCVETTKMLLGLFVGAGREVTCHAEVPWGYFSNEQIDMLLLDTKKKEFLGIEYKLSDFHGLRLQVQKNCSIGIINSKPRKEIYGLFGYTGKDAEIEYIAERLAGPRQYLWKSIYSGFGMVYYWAYKDKPNNFDGGVTGGGREGFASMYMRAIKNLHKHYGKLDFMLTHAALNSGYSVATSRKYYKRVSQSRN